MNASDAAVEPTELSARWTAGQAEVLVFGNRVAAASAAADAIAHRICATAQAKPQVRMIFAAAPSQSEVLKRLIALPDIPWGQVVAFHMDDYLDLPAEAPQRFANWLEEHLFSKVHLGEVHPIPAAGEPNEICTTYAAKLDEAPIDIVCLGIGVNGHIAFNDPPVADFDDPADVKVVELDPICRQQQVDDACFAAIENVPMRAITLTIPRLVNADALFCVVPGAHKRAAVTATLTGSETTDCPASILRRHHNCTIYLDPESAPNA